MEFREWFPAVLWCIGVVAICISLVSLLIWVQYGHQAAYFNRVYKTRYTAEDFFWSEKAIMIRHGLQGVEK